MNQQFDIFLSHNSKDKAAIREIKQLLRERELSCWLDEDELQPGVNWMPLLEKAIGTCQSAGAFVSSNGIGPWENEEIQALLSEAVRNKIPVIPVLLPGDYAEPKLPLFLKNRTFIDMRSGLSDEVIDKLIWGITGKKPQPKIKDVGLKPDLQETPSIHSDRLPTVNGGFFGRSAELQLLNDAWAGNTTRVIQFIAPGGTGKTKLLRHWLDHTADIDTLIAWSFYSQGASEDKQTSATPFFSHAFEKLGSTREKFATEEDKGEHLAELLRVQRCVLVLDGLEPLQHAGSGMRGELKDRAIRQLLKSLAGRNNGLCIITTRIAVHELADRAAVISHDLQNLGPADGVKLLQSLGVQGKPAELEKAVREYGCHALALTLLGNVLRLRYQGDVQRRDTLKALVKPTGSQESRHAFKVMQAYEDWFAGQPELALLHLLGLFDHPIEQVVLQVLWDAQIPHLTAGIDEDDWLEAIAGLREEHHLLSQHGGGGDLDCHPLIREYFGKQLQTQHPDAWQQAHARLYDYYKALPEKEFPDTLEEMQPLFSAVAHGCAAGLARYNLKLYLDRIQRNNESYLTHKLGYFYDDLQVLACFFTNPWKINDKNLHRDELPALYNWVGFSLRAVNRISEATDSLKTSISYAEVERNWSILASSANTLGEIFSLTGHLTYALKYAKLATNVADQYLSELYQLGYKSTLGNVFFSLGNDEDAARCFNEAEKIQQEWQPKIPVLYSEQGYRAFEFIEGYEIKEKLLRRAQYIQAVATRTSASNIEKALAQLAMAKTLNNIEEFQNAIELLEHAGQQQYIVHGLLARAALFRQTHDFARARQDLQEVFDIAESSGMRLHLTDYHLEMARLLVAEGAVAELQKHIEAAAKLINETGYHRRDAELSDLKTKIST